MVVRGIGAVPNLPRGVSFGNRRHMGVGRNIPYKSLRPIVDDTTSRWETYKLSLPK